MSSSISHPSRLPSSQPTKTALLDEVRLVTRGSPSSCAAWTRHLPPVSQTRPPSSHKVKNASFRRPALAMEITRPRCSYTIETVPSSPQRMTVPSCDDVMRLPSTNRMSVTVSWRSRGWLRRAFFEPGVLRVGLGLNSISPRPKAINGPHLVSNELCPRFDLTDSPLDHFERLCPCNACIKKASCRKKSCDARN